jgi:hypothetical protein
MENCIMNETKNKEVTPSLLKYVCPDNWSDQKKEANPIDAEEIVEAIKDGKEVEIINAVIEGSFILRSLNVESEVSIQRTKIKGPLDWSYATFKRVLNFENSIFETDATFKAVTVEKDMFLDNVTFGGFAAFSDITVLGIFYSRSANYKKQSIFTEGNFKKRIELNKSKFEGEANFVSARIGSVAVFTGAEFKERASFNGAQIGEGAFFNPATFEGEANFVSARIGSSAVFTGAEFKEQAIFNGAQIGEGAFFNPATFEGEANFVSARIGSSAVFTGSEFKEQASFSCAQIDGPAFFDLATFEGEANFVSARIGSSAEFTGAEFKERASFNSAQIQRESHFERTIFANYVSFENTSFETIYFGEPEVQFNAKIDLRGCIYNRIHPILFWEQLMEYLDPYDRQPFTQLEETFRRAGKDKLADDVYYELKCRESDQKTLRNPGAWLLDHFLWLFTGYGVRLHRLSVFIALILLIGTIIFHFEGAVEPKLDMQPLPHLPYWEAFWVSLNTFLPVEIPSGENWIPSSKIIRVLGIRFTTFATLLKLAGWILIPVGIAGISGILKR